MATRNYFVSGIAALGVVLTLAGCSETGTPRAGSSDVTSTETTTTSSEPPSTGASDGLAKVDPCQLLTQEAAGQLGLPATGKAGDTAGNPNCLWQTAREFTASITLRANKGVKDLNLQGTTPTPISIGTHTASKVAGGIFGQGKENGNCDVFIEVSESSSASVLVSNTGAKDTALACQRAEQIAKAIDSKLP